MAHRVASERVDENTSVSVSLDGGDDTDLLAGVTVLDFSENISGPYCCMYLADFGARVVKVELGSKGDPFRQHAGFHTLNRGKQGVALDLPAAPGSAHHDLLSRLVGAAQVVVVDRPRADADKLGIGYSQIHSMNPDVFYFHVPAWGHGSSLEGLPASPALVAAATGIMGTQISRSGEPMHHRLPLAAYATGVVAALACMAALRGRLVHGSPGQHIEVSEMAGSMALVHAADRQMLNQHPMGATGPIAPYRCYRAGDGEWFFLACANETFFRRMLDAVGLAALADHDDAADAWVFTNQAEAPRRLLVPQLETVFASRPRSHWLRVLAEADVPVAPIQNRDEFFRSPFVSENDMRVEVPHPELGSISMMGVPVRLTACPGKVRGRAPMFGEHQAAVSASLIKETAFAGAGAGAATGAGASAGAGSGMDALRFMSTPLTTPHSAHEVEFEQAATASPFRVSLRQPPASSRKPVRAAPTPHPASRVAHVEHSPSTATKDLEVSRLPFLHGVRVLDLSSYIAGPLGPRHLAMLGADVIKVESPAGDMFRSHQGFPDFNQGKRAVCIDLKKGDGRATFYRMVAHADVVVENFRPGVTKRLGVDYETLSAVNPKIVYLSAPGFGAYMEMARRPAFDPLLQAMSGAMLAQGGGRAPVLHTIPLNDVFTAALGAFGVAAALLHRAATGEGQHVHVSLTQSSLAIQAAEFTRVGPSDGVTTGRRVSVDMDVEASLSMGSPEAELDTPEPLPDFLAGPSAAERVYAAARMSEGTPEEKEGVETVGGVATHHVFVEAGTPAQRVALLQTVANTAPSSEVSGLSIDQLEGHDDTVLRVMQAAFARQPAGSWVKVLRAAGVPCMPVTPCNGQWEHPDMAAVGLVIPQPHPVSGEVQPRIGQLVRASHSVHRVGHRAPRFAEHTEEVLRAIGLSPGEISALVDTAAVHVES